MTHKDAFTVITDFNETDEAFAEGQSSGFGQWLRFDEKTISKIFLCIWANANDPKTKPAATTQNHDQILVVSVLVEGQGSGFGQ